MSKKQSVGRWYIAEPRGQTYALLLKAMAGHGNIATLALSRRKGPATAVPEALRNHLRKVQPVSNRFGNSGMADVAYLDLSKACVQSLTTCAQGWFDWQLPALPEDLAIQFADRVLIGSIAHEQTCWLEGEREFFDAIVQGVPGLKVLEGPGVRGGR